MLDLKAAAKLLRHNHSQLLGLTRMGAMGTRVTLLLKTTKNTDKMCKIVVSRN